MLSCPISFLLPPHPTKCSFFTNEEKKTAAMRLLKDASDRVAAPWRWKEVWAPLKECKFYVWMAYALVYLALRWKLVGKLAMLTPCDSKCYGTAASTAQTFLPQILSRFVSSPPPKIDDSVFINKLSRCYSTTPPSKPICEP
jgi:hypothetical protein